MTNRTEIHDYIERLQRDGRLLLRHIARRPEAVLPLVPPGQRSDTPACPHILFAEADQVQQNLGQAVDLMSCIDDLSRRAAPANVRSIRLTSAYLKIAVEGGEPPADIESEAKRIRRYIKIVAAICIVFFLGSVGLLAHIDYGRKLLLQVNALRQQEQGLLRNLVDLPLTESVLKSWNGDPEASVQTIAGNATVDNPARADTDGHGVHVCWKTPEKRSSSERPYAAGSHMAERWREPVTQKAADLCRQMDDIRVRLALAYTSLSNWNCITKLITRPWYIFAANPCAGPPDLPPGVDERAWQSHESRVSTATGVVAGFVLPMMLGCLGGCAYVLRRIDQKLSNWTLEPHDGTHALARVMLAALLGGLVGVIWTSGENVTLGGFTLSLAAVAFFVGFSVEVVFRVVENLILSVTATFGRPPASTPTPQSPPAGTASQPH